MFDVDVSGPRVPLRSVDEPGADTVRLDASGVTEAGLGASAVDGCGVDGGGVGAARLDDRRLRARGLCRGRVPYGRSRRVGAGDGPDVQVGRGRGDRRWFGLVVRRGPGREFLVRPLGLVAPGARHRDSVTRGPDDLLFRRPHRRPTPTRFSGCAPGVPGLRHTRATDRM
ncbi:hypothetical protein SDC9_107359 [bioreactor metagenome]|uniref:Uncharacterized protein n=1 Tax=bioreactor metagenome TaxID=1076179 RepID=A0A645B616_9ZZZZ